MDINAIGNSRVHFPARRGLQLEAPRSVSSFLNEDDVSGAPLGPREARLAKAWLRGAIGEMIEAAIRDAEKMGER